LIKEEVLRDAEQVETINSVLDVEWQKREHRGVTEEVMRAVANR
jgi:hypothetical protein